jgi:hypothetical protein
MTGGAPALTPTPRGAEEERPLSHQILRADALLYHQILEPPLVLAPIPSRFASAAESLAVCLRRLSKIKRKMLICMGFFLRGMGETTHRSREYLTPPCAVAALDVRFPPARGRRRRRRRRSKSPEGRERTRERDEMGMEPNGHAVGARGGCAVKWVCARVEHVGGDRTCYRDCNEKLCYIRL